MERRQFLQGVAGFSAWELASPAASAEKPNRVAVSTGTPQTDAERANAFLCEFTLEGSRWKVYEDLSHRDGVISFVSDKGVRSVLSKSAEASFAEISVPYLGLSLKEIGMTPRDLLADKLLADGRDPDPETVKSAVPPIGSAPPSHEAGSFRLPWDSFVGTKECKDTMPVFPSGRTRTYHPGQYFPELNENLARRRFEGLLGGWLPVTRKVMPIDISSHFELLIFGDVEATDEFIVQTWHRTVHVQDGRVTKAVYGYSYPAFPPIRSDPTAEQFYRALLVFANYWERQLGDFSQAAVPDQVWIDMSRHAFAKELMVRPGGVYPKYGAIDRDYYGSEYDGFQDIFTSSVYSNLEWGRFEQARLTIDNYFTSFVDARGAVNMRGPEMGQYGLILALIARYLRYTQDSALLRKHQQKILAMAGLLTYWHDESLRLATDHPGFGLIPGWSESDSCLMPKPGTWWQAYFGNSAFAVRGLQDLAGVWGEVETDAAAASEKSREWQQHSNQLRGTLLRSMQKNVRREMKPPYIGPLPGVQKTFLESIAQDRPSAQGWPHRVYSELLQADVLPPDLANLVIDCLRSYGGTTAGVVANVERPHADGRDMLGFISYGYAQMLLRLDRIEEYLLFLYSHRFHDHTRGSWTASEVAGITGDTTLFCIPAQLTIPLLVRWMLVLEASDAETLFLAKGIPRAWLASERVISIQEAPTRWGRISFRMQANMSSRTFSAHVRLPVDRLPHEVQIKFRLPEGNRIRKATVNGQSGTLGGVHGDAVIVTLAPQEKSLQVTGEFS